MIGFGGASMKRCEFICVLGGIVAGFWPRRRSIIVAIAALVLLPIEVSDAGWLSDVFKGSSKRTKSPKHVTSAKPATLVRRAASPKPRALQLAALGPGALNPSALKPVATMCDPSKFRIVLDVGHTAESEGAISARNVAEFVFNLRLAQRIEEKLKAEGFAETRLLLTEGKARPSLVKRVAAANNLHFKTSLLFAELVGKEMKAQGLQYAQQYTQAIMGRYQHPLLNKETGVYSYDQLVVLRKTWMAAVLLEAGSIINRDEELKMDSPERRDIISSGVTAAVKEFCDPRWAILGAL